MILLLDSLESCDFFTLDFNVIIVLTHSGVLGVLDMLWNAIFGCHNNIVYACSNADASDEASERGRLAAKANRGWLIQREVRVIRSLPCPRLSPRLFFGKKKYNPRSRAEFAGEMRRGTMFFQDHMFKAPTNRNLATVFGTHWSYVASQVMCASRSRAATPCNPNRTSLMLRSCDLMMYTTWDLQREIGVCSGHAKKKKKRISALSQSLIVRFEFQASPHLCQTFFSFMPLGYLFICLRSKVKVMH